MKIYLVVRNEPDFGRLVEPIGVTLDLAAAIAMCTLARDCVVELEAGQRYVPGEILPESVRILAPHCPAMPGWRTPEGLEVAESVETAGAT